MPRNGSKNLKDLRERTTEEQQEIARKGGKASGEARRRKRDMRKTLEGFLSMQATDKNKKAFEKNGYEAVDLTNSEAMAITMMAKAIAGDTKAISLVLDVMGDRFNDQLKARELELKEKQANDLKSEALTRLDSILEGLREDATKVDTETE